jgi:hypothetical protein
MSKTFYFVEMEKMEIPIVGFRTPQQLTLANTGNDADARSSLVIQEPNFYQGWDRLEGIHEHVDRTPRRMNGNPDYLHMSIVGGDTSFTAYYNKDEKLLLFNTSKNQVVGVQKRLIQFFPDTFRPKKGEVDFVHLLQNLQNATVISSWFNQINGQVSAVGLFGKRVNLDESFLHYKEMGKLSAITLDLSIDGEPKPINVMITKHFGVVLYTNWDHRKDLDFLFNMKTLLLYKETIIQ